MRSLHPTLNIVTYCWLGQQRLRRTSCSISECGCTSCHWWHKEVWLSSVTAYAFAQQTNSCQWCITASIVKLISTLWIFAFPCLMWPVDDILFRHFD